LTGSTNFFSLGKGIHSEHAAVQLGYNRVRHAVGGHSETKWIDSMLSIVLLFTQDDHQFLNLFRNPCYSGFLSFASRASWYRFVSSRSRLANSVVYFGEKVREQKI
jgi:hypothetical protein